LHEEKETGERYVRVEIRDGACLLDVEQLEGDGPAVAVGTKGDSGKEEEGDAKVKRIERLVFVPYYTRANRKGKGMMRVGLGRWYR